MTRKLIYALCIVAAVLCYFKRANAAPEPTIVTIASDGTESHYAIASVQRITVTPGAMQVERKGTLPQVDGVKCVKFGAYEFLPTSIESFQGKEITVKIYPNPVSEYLIINGINEDTLVEVYDLNGHSILQSNGNTLQVNTLSQGSYLLKVNNNIIKFIKK